MTPVGDPPPDSAAPDVPNGQPGTLLPDEQIMRKYAHRPASAELIIAVRRPIIARHTWNGTFKRFAEQLKAAFPDQYGTTTTRDIAKACTRAFNSPCGPSMDMINNVVELCVPAAERAERRAEFRALFYAARKDKGKDISSGTTKKQAPAKKTTPAKKVMPGRTAMPTQPTRTTLQQELNVAQLQLNKEQDVNKVLWLQLNAANGRSLRLARRARWYRTAWRLASAPSDMQVGAVSAPHHVARAERPAGVAVSGRPTAVPGARRTVRRRAPEADLPAADVVLPGGADAHEIVPTLIRRGLPPRWVAVLFVVALTVLAVVAAFAQLY